MPRRQLHPALILILGASLVGAALGRLTFDQRQPDVSFAAAAAPFALLIVYALYRSLLALCAYLLGAIGWTRSAPRILGIIKWGLRGGAVLAVALTAYACAHSWLLERHELRVAQLAGGEGAAADVAHVYPFADWPAPLSRVWFARVLQLTLPTDVFTAHKRAIQELGHLRSLTLTGGVFTDADVEAVSRVGAKRSFDELVVENVDIQVTSFDMLSSLPQLSRLILRDCRILAPKSAFFRSFPAIPSLHELRMRGTPLAGTQLAGAFAATSLFRWLNPIIKAEGSSRRGYQPSEDGPLFGSRWILESLVDPYYSPVLSGDQPFEIKV